MNPATYNNNSFSRENRITKPSEIYSIYRNGKKISNTWLSLCYRKGKKREMLDSRNMSNNINSNRLGILIKRNVFKSSVERNRFKRIVREIFRCLNLTPAAPYEIIVCAEKRPTLCDRKFFNSEIKALLKKGKISC